MKTVTLLAALTLVTAVSQHAIAADLLHQTNSTPGLPGGVPGECVAGFCGTPADNGGGGLGQGEPWSDQAGLGGPELDHKSPPQAHADDTRTCTQGCTRRPSNGGPQRAGKTEGGKKAGRGRSPRRWLG